MARIKKNRSVQMPPNFCGFRPEGGHSNNEKVVLVNFEEYEALKLCDYELLTQAEAAKLMAVSRPTFTRIYESVRRKIAQAFIEGSAIRFEGGNVDIASWYKCAACNITFTLVQNAPETCPFCKEKTITKAS
ncbi:DUF134 domain-containing protein [Flammeovirgaceae bacterium SG7u.111]|nr:DUF134 domain-containing protein [Flammeovirgaceae bacterium SG7u.132]WPO36985.1 DUF134 domain-containing protein [Flammeovirgaceae bacterium SG7u.111]